MSTTCYRCEARVSDDEIMQCRQCHVWFCDWCGDWDTHLCIDCELSRQDAEAGAAPGGPLAPRATRAVPAEATENARR